MEPAKKILIICTDNYHRQPRVLRTIEALKKDYTISVAGISTTDKHEVNFIDLSQNLNKNRTQGYWHFNKPLMVRLPISFYYKYVKQKQYSKTRFYEYQYWSGSKMADLHQLKQHPHNLIISHGIDTLPLAIKLADKKVPVIFNAHEYYPLEFEQDANWLKTEGAKATYIINKYLPGCAHLFCVSQLILKKYLESVKIPSTVITNAPNYLELEPKKTDPKKIRIIHHGIAMKERNIEAMASIMNYLDDRYELNFMLTVADKEYYEELKQKLSLNNRIVFLPAVPLQTLCGFLNNFDIGYYILPPANFNTTYALPNKLFEYVQARLCLAFGPSPEMKSMIEKYELGIVGENFDPESIAEKIKKLSADDIFNFKKNAHKHALELSSEANQKKILETVSNLLKN